MPILPVELVEIIIDYLQNSNKDLANCCRVCHDWYPRAHYHLFRKIVLHPRNMARFFAACQRQPTLATGIDELTLTRCSAKAPERPPNFLWTINMRTFRLRRIALTDPWIPMAAVLSADSLAEISLRACQITDARELLRWMRQFPRLKHFAAFDVDFASWERDHLGSNPWQLAKVYSPLRSLSLAAGPGSQRGRSAPLRIFRTMAYYMRWLEALAVLHIKLFPHDLEEFGRRLPAVAETLRELRLTVEHDSQPLGLGEPKPMLSLSGFCNLAALGLDVRLCRRPTDGEADNTATAPHPNSHKPQDHLRWFVPLIRSVHTPECLRYVKLVIRVPPGCACDPSEAVDWHGVSRALADRRFEALSRVAVTVIWEGKASCSDESRMRTEAKARTKEHMSALEKRGILEWAFSERS